MMKSDDLAAAVKKCEAELKTDQKEVAAEKKALAVRVAK